MRAVGADTDHLDTLSMILAIEGVEGRHFVAARLAPGGPEVDDDDLAAQCREVEGLAAQLRNDERRRRLADVGVRISGSHWKHHHQRDDDGEAESPRERRSQVPNLKNHSLEST